VITVRARATVPIINANVLKELGIVKVADHRKGAAENSTHRSDTPEHDSVATEKLCKIRRDHIDNISKSGVGKGQWSFLPAFTADIGSDCAA
jgi:hypothetical protein